MAINVRELALEALILIDKNEYSYQDALNGQLSKYQYLLKQDRAFLNRLVSGTVEYKLRLDYVINLFSKMSVNKQKPFIRSLLRMSTYQILFLDAIPDSAAVNEAVKLAKKKGFSRLSGFVNGVLRSIVREREDITYPDADTEDYLSICYSMPKWIVSMLTDQYGSDKASLIVKASLEEAPINIFINRRKMDIEGVITALANEGVTPHRIKPDKTSLKSDISTAFSKNIDTYMSDLYKANALRLKGVDYLSRYRAFMDGLFTVQDLSSMLVGFLVEYIVRDMPDKEKIRVLDMCSAPGSKAIYVANISERIKVYSRDISEYKRDLIVENIERLDIDNIDVKISDALIHNESDDGRYDIVLLDAPCSGLGVMRRKKDIKYNISNDKIDELISIQKKMLKNAQQYTRFDGYLIYSTCTVNVRENREQVEEFLADYDSYELIYEKQLLTGVDNSDGFFIAVMRRR